MMFLARQRLLPVIGPLLQQEFDEIDRENSDVDGEDDELDGDDTDLMSLDDYPLDS